MQASLEISAATDDVLSNNDRAFFCRGGLSSSLFGAFSLHLLFRDSSVIILFVSFFASQVTISDDFDDVNGME